MNFNLIGRNYITAQLRCQSLKNYFQNLSRKTCHEKTSSLIESNDEGNALSARKKATQFDDEQKKFVYDKFIVGIKGKKYQPEQVESMMRKAKTLEGTSMFTRDKCSG
jgi:hypothetical protein